MDLFMYLDAMIDVTGKHYTELICVPDKTV